MEDPNWYRYTKRISIIKVHRLHIFQCILRSFYFRHVKVNILMNTTFNTSDKRQNEHADMHSSPN